MREQGQAEHRVTPRALLFLQRKGRWLLIRGAEHKWWAGRWNGLGGSVRAGEGIETAARREALEETGLKPEGLELAAVGQVESDPPVLLFVFLGRLPAGGLRPTDEGKLRWFRSEELAAPGLELMPDLPALLPRLAAHRSGRQPFFFVTGADGSVRFDESA